MSGFTREMVVTEGRTTALINKEGVVLLQVWYTYALFPILGNGNKSQYVLRH